MFKINFEELKQILEGMVKKHVTVSLIGDISCGVQFEEFCFFECGSEGGIDLTFSSVDSEDEFSIKVDSIRSIHRLSGLVGEDCEDCGDVVLSLYNGIGVHVWVV